MPLVAILKYRVILYFQFVIYILNHCFVLSLLFSTICIFDVTQVAERHDALVRLRNEVRDTEEKLRDALTASQHQTELTRQLREELKQAKAKVS